MNDLAKLYDALRELQAHIGEDYRARLVWEVGGWYDICIIDDFGADYLNIWEADAETACAKIHQWIADNPDFGRWEDEE